MIQLKCEHVSELFTGFGQRGVPAEAVASRVLKEARQYIDAEVAVGTYLADQLMLPLAIGAHQASGGGAFCTLPLSAHSTTHLEILQDFLGVRVRVTDADNRCVVEMG
jgi:RNA 3'-terminal phosphate cyclase (ATP)